MAEANGFREIMGLDSGHGAFLSEKLIDWLFSDMLATVALLLVYPRALGPAMRVMLGARQVIIGAPLALFSLTNGAIRKRGHLAMFVSQ